MKSYEIYSCRRKALRLTKEQLADRAGVHRLYVEFYEEGKNVPSWVEESIKTTIRAMFSSMDSIEHYRTRILELAIEIRDENQKSCAMTQISHMMVELGKLQNELMGNKLKTRAEWES